MTAHERGSYAPLPLHALALSEGLHARRPAVQGEPAEAAFARLLDVLVSTELMAAAGYPQHAIGRLEELALRASELVRHLLDARDRARTFAAERRA